MSNLHSVRNELRLVEKRLESPGIRRLGMVATIALLLVAVAAGLAEIHLLPSFSAEDFSCILFGAG